MTKKLRGACLCGAVKFSVEEDFRSFYQCHCKQCQQQSGSAYAANIFTRPDNVEWLEGEENIIRYHHPKRSFANAFCKVCGCSVPYQVPSAKALIVPAGALLDEPAIRPKANIFKTETACWFEEGLRAEGFAAFPKK